MIGVHTVDSHKTPTHGVPSSSHTQQSATRRQTLNAVEYYNHNVLRARMEAGLAGTRNFSSINGENMYRSNSSLELLEAGKAENHFTSSSGPLRREYGSQSSIDIISDKNSSAAKGDNFFAMLQEYRPAVLNLRNNSNNNNNNNNNSKENKKEQTETIHKTHLSAIDATNLEDQIDHATSSPKLRMKLKLWGQTKASKSQTNIPIAEEMPNGVNMCSNENTSVVSIVSSDVEERTRRRAFAHFDCQSLTANLGYAAKVRGLLLARRRNTTTGASAAAMYSRSSTPDRENGDEDLDERMCNDLIEVCPFFRNEIGGEEEREVSLTRLNKPCRMSQKRAIHRPLYTYAVSMLECNIGESLWSKQACPYQSNSNFIEQIDNGAYYYRQYFYGQDHQNFIGMDEHLGPVAISIKKEKPPYTPVSPEFMQEQHLYRMIVRTSELLTLRGCIFEESIPNPRGSNKSVNTKDVIDHVAPEVQISCLRLAINTPQCEQQLLKLDEQGLTNKYKVGILYCRAGQATEEDMYNNEHAGPAFTEFLETIGKRVRLKGFENYKGGLDTKTDSTGTHSVYTTHQNCEIMFHVSTMLPFTPNNRQQLLRKRHIGNDIVTIVFQEPGALPFTPKNIRSQFQHVFIIVRRMNSGSENTSSYRIAVSRSRDVPVFGPPIRTNACYQKNKSFVDFLLAKVINAENAAHRSEKFATMATRTRQEYLKDLCNNFSSQTPVETGQKLKIFPSKKKEPTKPRFKGDAMQRGAFCWQVVLHDSGSSTQIECFLGISTETFVLIEESSRQTVFAAPNRSILGWSTNGNALRVYHHQGECITMNMRDYGDRDEQLEVIERLRAVSNGCGALELSLHRNSMGQLGFHVQPDGIVTQVELNGPAWAAGLRQGCRLVEICKVAVATLSHDQMVDLLKTSIQVTVTVIESFSDFSPRRGCFLSNCKFNSIIYQYENDTPQKQQASSIQRRFNERSFSPPKSVDSSGYGTASSSRSFMANNDKRYVPDMGTLTSSSSGHSSNDEKWYDVVENSNLQISDYESNGRYLKRGNVLPMHQNKNTVIHENPPIYKHNSNNNIEFIDSMPAKSSADANLLNRSYQMDEIEPKTSASSKITVKPMYSVPVKDTSSQPSYSEDELEKLNKDDTPQLKRSATTNAIYVVKKAQTATVASTSSSSSSRNNSPRPTAETRLKAGVSRSINQAHRASMHCTSTLKEDLLKLINPDYLHGSSDDNFHDGDLPITLKCDKKSTNSHSLGNLSMTSTQLSPLKTPMIRDDTVVARSKTRFKEESEFNPVDTRMKFQKPKSVSPEEEIIITTARPATVISPVSELVQNTANYLHIKEDQINTSSRDHFYNPSDENGHAKNKIPTLSDLKEAEWKNFLNNSSKNVQINGHQESIYDELNALTSSEPITVNQFLYQTASNSNSPICNSGAASVCSNSSVNNVTNSNESTYALPELQNQVSQLSDRVMRETRRRRSLEVAVKKLTEENRRLQDESQQAVQQLKRFTEWFFQTIDKQ